MLILVGVVDEYEKVAAPKSKWIGSADNGLKGPSVGISGGVDDDNVDIAVVR